jgi:chromatin remodeling complex protein RSC6
MAGAKKDKKPNPALMKPLQPSAEPAAVVGSSPLPRTKVVSKVWEYIKANNLQDSANKREILADDKLRAVFGAKDKVSMFEMNKHFTSISRELTPFDHKAVDLPSPIEVQSEAGQPRQPKKR